MDADGKAKSREQRAKRWWGKKIEQRGVGS
jgi:hypothetical protein